MRPVRWAVQALPAISTLALLIAGITLGGCSSSSRDRWLRALFDDPPTAAPAAESHPIVLPDAAPDTSAAVTAAQVEVFEHSPFAAGDCRACHGPGGARSFRGGDARTEAAGAGSAILDGRLTGEADRLCAGCHGDLASETLALKYAVVHAPLTAGGCLFCHHPHQSRVRYLLRESPPGALCLRCHSPAVLGDLEGHEVPSESACLDCHDPHASNRRALLRERER